LINIKKFLFLISISALFSGAIPDDYFQQYVEYDIDATLNDKDHTLSSHLTLKYTNNSNDTLDFIWFHLWPNAYKNNETAFAKQQLRLGSTKFFYSEEKNRGYIDNLMFEVNNEKVKLEIHNEWIDVAKVTLNNPLIPGETIIITTPFFVKIPNVFSRLGHTGKHYEMTQWYPKPAVYDKDGWHEMPYLNMGEFYSEFGTFDVKITLPEEYVVMATGDLINGEKEYRWLDSLSIEGKKFLDMPDKGIKKWIKESKKEKSKQKKNKDKLKKNSNFKTLHFHQKNVHDFAWFADKNYIVQKGELELPNSKNKVTLWSMYLPKNAVLWKKSIEYLHDSGYWYSKFYGDYPYKHITAVDGDMSAGGGMEYPNITVIAKMPSRDLLEMVIMHEVGHNWFYGIIGSNERDHAWMDEGLNEYSNFRYWEKKYGMDSGMQVSDKFVKYLILRNNTFRWMNMIGCQRQCFRGDAQIIDQHSDKFQSSNYGSMVYSKTASLTRYLQDYLGEPKMDEIMQDYVETWKFKHPSPEDFKQIFSKHIDKNLDWYFDDGLKSVKNIDLKIKKDKNDFYLYNQGDVLSPGYVEFYDKNNILLDSLWVDGFKDKFLLSHPQNTSYAILDPDNVMFDINLTNHTTRKKGVSLPMFFDQPDFHSYYFGTITPSFTLNSVNNGTGFTLRRGSVPLEKFNYTITPSYDNKSKNPLVELNMGWQEFRKFGMDVIRTNLGYFNTQQRETIKTSGEIIIREPIINYPYYKLKLDVNVHLKLPELYQIIENKLTASHRLSLSYHDKPSPFTHFNIKSKFTFVKQHNNQFMSIDASSHFNHRFNKKIKLQTQLHGYHVIASDLYPWLPGVGGSTDPDYQSYVWDRTFEGDFSVYQHQYIKSVPSARISPHQQIAYNSALGIDIELAGIIPMGNLYFDYLLINKSDLNINMFGEENPQGLPHYFSTGISLSLGFIKLNLPFYMSWENPEKLTIDKWVNYLRPEINLDINKLIRKSLR
jgi:hypothetical protein